MKKVLTSLIGAGISSILLSQGIAVTPSDALTVTDSNGKQVIVYKKSYALVIATGNYQHWSKLNNVANEAQQVKEALERQGFEVTFISNPTGIQLTNGLKTFIDNYGYSRDNRLVIFFAGHGHTRQQTKGYLVPVDAPDPIIDEQGFLRSALPMQQIMTWASLIEAKHVLFVFDSCFSGTIFKQRSSENNELAYINDVMNKPVRQFLTAGDADEKVPAKSVFTPLFIRALEGEADVINKDGYVTGTELGNYLRQNLSEYTQTQTPQFGTIKDPDLDRGDIVFRSLIPIPQTITVNSSSLNSNSSTRSQPDNSQPQNRDNNSTLSNFTLIVTAPNQNIEEMYEKLEQFLQQKDFRKADEQTWELIKQIGNGGNKDYLIEDEVINFSCDDLKKMDDLWVKYSNGKFGFSVQKDIWESVGGNNSDNSVGEVFSIFEGKVGWKINQDVIFSYSYDELTFSLNTRKGHLPYIIRFFEQPDLFNISKERFFDRIANCGM